MTDASLDLRDIDRLAAETRKLAQALRANRLNPAQEMQLLMQIEVNQSEIRRLLQVALFKMQHIGADIEPGYDLD